MKTPAVEGDDAGGFLAAMLERMQAERGDGGGIGMAENAEHPAFLAEAVGIRDRNPDLRGDSGRGLDRGSTCHRVVQTLQRSGLDAAGATRPSINWFMPVRSDRS